VSASFGGLVIGSNYYYTVFASNASGTSPVASSPIVQYIPNPYNLTLNVSSSNATMSWSSTGTSPTFYYTLTQTTAYSYTSGTTTTIANSNTTASSVTPTFTAVSGNFYYYSIYQVTSVGTSLLYLSPIVQYVASIVTPLLIASGSTLWLDGVDPDGTGVKPANNSTLATWVDKSGSANSATGGVSPTYSSTSNTVQFNGSAYLRTTAAAGNNTASTFVVFSVNSLGSFNVFGGNALSTAAFFSSGSQVGMGDWNSNVATASTAIAAGSNYILSSTISGGTASIGGNGGTLATGSTTFSGTGTFTVGAGYIDHRNKLSGTISEVIEYSNAVTTTQRQQVEGYLAWKWGLQSNLPGGHPYYSAPPVLAPAAPTSPTLSITSGTATLGWTVASGATAYNWILYMSSNSNYNGTSNASGSTSSNAPTSAPTGLTSGKFWYFTVVSSNASGVSSAIASSIVSY
jgi:hypothetical protein